MHPALRNTVRLRVEGERVALPGPSLTPYLVGLLVLLGMLGTLLGMVATLRGTGAALDSATDLHAIHASLAAPIKGLGFAFGTSIAGVATSAMLGLMSALCRSERLDAAQTLDDHIATTLRTYSQTWQREESFRLMQRQADAMPALIDRMQTMMSGHRTAEPRAAGTTDREPGSVARQASSSIRRACIVGRPVVAAAASPTAREPRTLQCNPWYRPP